ncbi:unnamed protein product, partial [Urochloa humidicola]
MAVKGRRRPLLWAPRQAHHGRLEEELRESMPQLEGGEATLPRRRVARQTSAPDPVTAARWASCSCLSGGRRLHFLLGVAGTGIVYSCLYSAVAHRQLQIGATEAHSLRHLPEPAAGTLAAFTRSSCTPPGEGDEGTEVEEKMASTGGRKRLRPSVDSPSKKLKMDWIPDGMDHSSACRIDVRVADYLELCNDGRHLGHKAFDFQLVVDKDTTNFKDISEEIALKVKHGSTQGMTFTFWN